MSLCQDTHAHIHTRKYCTIEMSHQWTTWNERDMCYVSILLNVGSAIIWFDLF